MAAPQTVITPPGKPRVSQGLAAQHTSEAHVPLIPMGDPFGFSHKVEPSHVANVSRVRPVGVHKNFYTSIPALQAFAEKFWGIARKVTYVQRIAHPRGVQRTKFAGGTDIDIPERSTYSAFATVLGDERARIRNGRDYLVR